MFFRVIGACRRGPKRNSAQTAISSPAISAKSTRAVMCTSSGAARISSFLVELNIYPKEVEAAIDIVSGVVESAVIGVPHPDLGEGVTAIVVREKDATVDETTIAAALEGTLAKYKQPKRILFVEELPRNAMGKVQKSVLRDVYGEIYKTSPQATSLESGPSNQTD